MIELGLTPDGRWTAGLDEYLGAAAAAGFTSVGLGAEVAGPAAAEAVAANGLRCHEVIALSIRRDEEATLISAADLAQRAAAAGADWVLTVFGTRVRDESVDLAVRCADILASAGVKMALEFGPGGPAMGSIGAALAVSDAVGPERSGVMIDTWHFAHGDSTWEELESIPLDRIAYVQFTDALALQSDQLLIETTTRRAMPGDGVLELDRFASTLLERGWDGLVSVEVLSDELRTLPVAEFARRAFEATAPFWR